METENFSYSVFQRQGRHYNAANPYTVTARCKICGTVFMEHGASIKTAQNPGQLVQERFEWHEKNHCKAVKK